MLEKERRDAETRAKTKKSFNKSAQRLSGFGIINELNNRLNRR